ncbi:c-type cytochrome [candidate division KSB1 bacterium]|nr:c-type cytochrome [candidate division KSB1 bacterium]
MKLYILIPLILVVILIHCQSSQTIRYSDPELAEKARFMEHNAYERGQSIWFDETIGRSGRNCESCHPDGSLTNAETYPRYKHVLKTMATISMTHNFAVVHESLGEPWIIGSDDANAVVLFVKAFANGKQIRMAQPHTIRDEWTSKGKALFYDSSLSSNRKICAHCHTSEYKTQAAESFVSLDGIAAIYPRYRSHQNRVIILEQQINTCIETQLQQTPLPLDDASMIALVSYITSLSEGKKVAVARFRDE